jgi:hypothetical protein
MSSLIDSQTGLTISTAAQTQPEREAGNYDRLWLARHQDSTAFFTAPNHADDWWLFTIAQALLGIPLTENAADLLTAPHHP